MAGPSVRDRFFTRPVAEAITAPSGILLAGVGASVGIVAGLPLVMAAGVGVAAWGVRVALAMPRRHHPERTIDPLALKDPWRTFVWEAKRAQKSFHDATARARTGPLRERLDTLGERINTAVGECWQIAQAGQALGDARAAIDVDTISRDLRNLSQSDPSAAAGSRLERTRQALQSQLDTAGRLDATLADTVDRLRLLDARLGEAVTRAIELSARGQGVDDLSTLDTDVDILVGEMESLRLALDETTPTSLVDLPPTRPGPLPAPAPLPPPPSPSATRADRDEPGTSQPSPG